MSCVADAQPTRAALGAPTAQVFAAGSPRVLVAGATGFAGALAAHLLWRHPRFELAAVTGRSELGRRLDDLYPRYRVPLQIEQLDLDAAGPLDAAVVAYPHAAAAPTVAELHERGARVVDLSADFRLCSLQTYERWYGAHPRPELLAEAVYGLTELHREGSPPPASSPTPAATRRRRCSALAPLARAGLIADVVIDAKQGISGAGRTFDETTHLSMAGENILPYKVAAHRHTPEIEEQLALLAAAPPELAVQFQAHLVPLDQGELASCYVTPTRRVERRGARRAVRRRVRARAVRRGASTRRRARAMCSRRTSAACSPRPTRTRGKVIVLSAIDNLWKGDLLAGGAEPQRYVRPARDGRPA